MHQIALKNKNGLVPFLDTTKYKYQVINDGWKVIVNLPTLNVTVDSFELGTLYGQWLAANPQLVTIEELEQRGDIPGL